MDEAKKLLFSQDYNVGEIVTFHLYREQKDGNVTVTLAYQFAGAPEVVCKRFFYPVCAEVYQNPYLSWYNLICCSNNYGPIPVVSYMNESVQNGKKIAATVYPDDALQYMDLIARLGEEDYYCFPFHPREYEYMLYVSKKGTLADYFNLDEILSVYKNSGVSLDEEKMKFYFQQELSWFGNEEECDIEIHKCLGDEKLAITGLLFGYPVESTVALIKKTIDMCEQ